MTQTHLKHVGSALWLSAMLGACGLILSLLFWVDIPTPMPIHWDAHGQPDRFGSKLVGLLLMPALTVLLPVLIAALTRLDPRREHVSRSTSALGLMLGGLAAFLFVLHGLMIKAAMSATMQFDSGALIMLIGVLFIVLGNAMPKFGSNYFIGIRTPWTLKNEKVWIKTHQLGGRLFVLGGLATIVLGLLMPAGTTMHMIFLALTLFIAFAPFVYSWWIFQKMSSLPES